MGHNSLDELRQSMVRILNTDGKTAGSGFIIRADGYLVTCHHVIYLLESLTVEYLGQQYSAEWCEELSNPEVDIAILKIPVENAVAVSIVNPPELATAVTVYGFPPKQEKYFPEGFPVAGENIQPSAPLNVLATYQIQNITANNLWNKLPQPDANFLSHRINAKVDPGTSGGPVLATEFEGVVGVIQCSKSDESYVIRWDNILPQLDQLGLEPEKNAVCDFLSEIEDHFKHIKLFHTQQPIVLTDQYIPIQVTLERRYKKSTEDIGSYGESEAELRQAYALKGSDEELRREEEQKKLEEEIRRTIVDWEQAKKDHEKIVVLADPGMGKSTLLRMEALTTAQQERQKLENQQTVDEIIFPIFLRLSELAKTDGEIFDIVPDLIKLNHVKTFEKIKHLLEQKLKQGKCLLLLDALDEVPTEQRIPLIEKLSRFTRNYPCQIISTSRIVGYAGSPVDSAKEVEIVPFSQQQTENYIQTWFNNAKEDLEDESVSAEGLIQELQNKPQINGLAQNPLLLSLLCSLYQTKGLILPARKAQVYEQAVNYILSDWRSDNQRPRENQAYIDLKQEILEDFAYQISRENKEVFQMREIRKKIQDFLKNKSSDKYDPETIIIELTEEDGIIQKLDRTGDRYLFLHRTFQEYFTASYLNQSQDITLAKPLFWNYNQHETLILLAGMMTDPIPLIEAIYKEKDDIFKTQLLLAGRCIAECGEISHPIVTKVVNKIFQFWRKYPDLDFIKSTVIILGQASSQVVQFLIKLLGDEKTYVRRIVASALGEIGSQRAVEPLIERLGDEDRYVRSSAALALGKIGSELAVHPLIERLEDGYGDVRSSAAEALGKIGSQQAVRPLIERLRDGDSNDRWCAASALGKIGLEEAVRLLIERLGDEDRWVRRSAAEALGTIGSQEAVQLLIERLGDEEGRVRSSAASALGKIGSERAVELLIERLGDEDWHVRSSAASALGKIGSEEAVRPLIERLGNGDGFWDGCVRRSAAEALGQIGSELAVRPLIERLGDEDRLVRSNAAKALGQIGSERVVQLLIERLGDENSGVRSSAALALGEIGSERAVEPLIERLGDKNSGVRSSAASALGKIGSELAVQLLIERLGDEDRWVRSSAAEALGTIGSELAVQLLIERLGNEDRGVRSSAASALGEIGTIEVLKQLIQHPSVDIYESASFAMARKLAIQFSNENLPFIPVYRELVRYSLKAYIQRSLYTYKTRKKIPILPTATLAILVTLLATVATLHFSGIYSLPFLRESQPEQSSP